MNAVAHLIEYVHGSEYSEVKFAGMMLSTIVVCAAVLTAYVAVLS